MLALKLNFSDGMRYIVASILGALIMFGMSYTWHAVILNDFSKINLPPAVFYSLLIFVYLVISLVLSIVFDHFYKYFSSTFIKFSVGAVVGFFLYLIAFTLNFGLAHSQMKHLVIDFTWQMLEQGMGALVVGLVISLAKKAKRIHAD